MSYGLAHCLHMRLRHCNLVTTLVRIDPVAQEIQTVCKGQDSQNFWRLQKSCLPYHQEDCTTSSSNFMNSFQFVHRNFLASLSSTKISTKLVRTLKQWVYGMPPRLLNLRYLHSHWHLFQTGSSHLHTYLQIALYSVVDCGRVHVILRHQHMDCNVPNGRLEVSLLSIHQQTDAHLLGKVSQSLCTPHHSIHLCPLLVTQYSRDGRRLRVREDKIERATASNGCTLMYQQGSSNNSQSQDQPIPVLCLTKSLLRAMIKTSHDCIIESKLVHHENP